MRQASAVGGHGRHGCHHCLALAGPITAIGSLRVSLLGACIGRAVFPGSGWAWAENKRRTSVFVACFTLSPEFSPSGRSAFAA